MCGSVPGACVGIVKCKYMVNSTMATYRIDAAEKYIERVIGWLVFRLVYWVIASPPYILHSSTFNACGKRIYNVSAPIYIKSAEKQLT